MSKHLESLYQNLLNGKLPHNLSWSEAVELVRHLGEVQPHGNDEFVFRIGGQRVIFKRPHTHDLGLEEVSRLRKFLKEAESSEHPEEAAKPARMIVVIDHHAAHVFQDFGGSRPVDEHKVRPYDPFNFHHHLIHRKEAHYRGERVPEEHSFYEEVAKDLVPAKEIVLIGHATGKSNAADFLKEYLQTHYPDISRRSPRSRPCQWSGEYEFQLRAKERMKIILPVVCFVIFLVLYVVFHSLTEAMILIFPTFYAMTGGLILQWLLGYNFSVAVWVGISPCLASR